MSNSTRIHRECGESSKWCFITDSDAAKDLTFEHEEQVNLFGADQGQQDSPLDPGEGQQGSLL